MSKILIVYGTAYGQTERIMQQVCRLLVDAGHVVTVHRGDRLPRGLAVQEFNGILIAASILGGRHQRYIRDFVRFHVRYLNDIPSAFVSVSGAAASPDPKGREEAQRRVDEFLQKTGWHPRRTQIFGGAVAYTHYSWALRLFMRWISRRNGGPTDTSRDHEFTDWHAVAQFAKELATEIFETDTIHTLERTEISW